MKYIYISSSNVAKYTGHNKYESLEKTVNELLSKNGIQDRYVPKSNVEEKLVELSKDQLTALKKELKLSPESCLQQVEASIKANVMAGSYSATLTEQQSKALIDEKLTDKPILSLVSDGIKQDLRMRRGNIKENTNLNTIQKKKNIQINQRNSRMYTKELYRCDDYCIVMRGKVDGQSDDSIIESKNRTRCLFKELREYERVQLECYMYLTGLHKALLTEHYNDTEHCIEYIHHDGFWLDCVDRVVEFMERHVRPYLSE